MSGGKRQINLPWSTVTLRNYEYVCTLEDSTSVRTILKVKSDHRPKRH